MHSVLNVTRKPVKEVLQTQEETASTADELLQVIVWLFALRLYEVFIHSECVSSSRRRSAHPSLEKQTEVRTWKQSNVLLWTGSAAKHVLAHLKKKQVYAVFRIFSCFTLPSHSPSWWETEACLSLSSKPPGKNVIFPCRKQDLLFHNCLNRFLCWGYCATLTC